MKISKRNLCKLQEVFVNISCPAYNGKLVTLQDTEDADNAVCEDCSCRFEFHPDVSFSEPW